MRANCKDIEADILEIEEDICYTQYALQAPNISPSDIANLSEKLEILRAVRKSAIKELKDDYYIEYGT